jgi:hypothetical protein
MDLFADRTSSGTMKANQLWVWFASMAYVLLDSLRRIALQATDLADASCGTIHRKSFKIDALVIISVRRIKLAMASSCPYKAVLLREGYRDGDKFKNRTLANLSDWPGAKIEALRRVLRDEAVAQADHQALTLLRSLPHGHLATALGTLRKLGLDRILSQAGRQPRRTVALCKAMIVARLIDPASKLATARGLDDNTATCSLGQMLDLGSVDEQELARRSTGAGPAGSSRPWRGAT